VCGKEEEEEEVLIGCDVDAGRVSIKKQPYSLFIFMKEENKYVMLRLNFCPYIVFPK